MRYATKKGAPMSYPMPEGEDLRKAVKWISQNLEDDPNKKLLRLVEQATFRFDLSPKDAEYLINFFRFHDKA
jgi:hypothetical protein